MAITCVVTWPIAKLLDCLLGSDHGTYYKRSQLKVLLDLHGDDQYVENPLTEQEIKIIKVMYIPLMVNVNLIFIH